jgi:acyl-CoA thioesterase-1
MNISPAQKSFGALIFISTLLLFAVPRPVAGGAAVLLTTAVQFSMRLLLVTLCAVAIVVGAGCGKSVALPKLSADATILAFGDSLTFGTGANEDESYPSRLGALVGRKVVRAGIPGEVSEAGLARLPEVLDEHAPKLLILCHGGNDFLRKLPRDKAAANLRAMIRLARDRGIDVVLVGTPEPSLGAAPPAFYAELAKEFRIPYEGEVLGTVLRDRTLKADPVHPNAAGYKVIAEKVAALLRKAGAV